MFYSKYSNFSPEQILTEDYKELCGYLLSIAKVENVKKKMERYII